MQRCQLSERKQHNQLGRRLRSFLAPASEAGQAVRDPRMPALPEPYPLSGKSAENLAGYLPGLDGGFQARGMIDHIRRDTKAFR
jgi:hypothetical protein